MSRFWQHVGQRGAVVARSVLPGIVTQFLLGAGDAGRVGALGDGAQVVIDGGGDLVGVGDGELVGFLFGQVAEVLEHFLRRVVVQRRLVVGVLKAVAGLQHRAVDPVLGFLEMRVAGGDDGLVQVSPSWMTVRVEVFDRLEGVDLAAAHHELVVAQGLDFEVVVVVGDAQQLLVGLAGDDGAVELARLARRREQQPFTVLVEQAARHARLFEEILRVRGADDAVQVFKPHLVLHQDESGSIFS